MHRPKCLLATHCPAHPGCPLFLPAVQPQLHQTRIASFLALFAEQQVEEGGLLPTSPLSLSSPSTPSWGILLLPPFSGPWHPRNCLLYPKALSSLSTFSRSPGSPGGSRGKGKEAEGQGPAPGWKLPSSFLLSTRWKTGATAQRNTWL